jgi:hypothetical protein
MKTYKSGPLGKVTIPENDTNMRYAEYADAIYSRYFGHIDDAPFAAEKTQEIYDWLCDGDARFATLEQLTEEWAAYDTDDIIANSGE